MTLEELQMVIVREELAVRRFVDHFGPIFRGVARAVLKEWTRPALDEEDLVQWVFVELFRSDARALRRWNPEGGRSLDNFLRVLARQRIIDRLRPRHAEVPTPDEELVVRVGASAPGSDVRAEGLERALERYRAAASEEEWRFVQRFVAGDEVAELAAAFGLTVGAVHQRISRFRRRLLALIEGRR